MTSPLHRVIVTDIVNATKHLDPAYSDKSPSPERDTAEADNSGQQYVTTQEAQAAIICDLSLLPSIMAASKSVKGVCVMLCFVCVPARVCMHVCHQSPLGEAAHSAVTSVGTGEPSMSYGLLVPTPSLVRWCCLLWNTSLCPGGFACTEHCHLHVWFTG